MLYEFGCPPGILLAYSVESHYWTVYFEQNKSISTSFSSKISILSFRISLISPKRGWQQPSNPTLGTLLFKFSSQSFLALGELLIQKMIYFCEQRRAKSSPIVPHHKFTVFWMASHSVSWVATSPRRKSIGWCSSSTSSSSHSMPIGSRTRERRNSSTANYYHLCRASLMI